VDESAGDVSGGEVAAHHDIGVAALLEVRIEDRFAGRAPARHLPWLLASANAHSKNSGGDDSRKMTCPRT
jgi:hypothetical protein